MANVSQWKRLMRYYKERRAKWTPRKPKYEKGVLRLFSQHAASPMKGAYLDY